MKNYKQALMTVFVVFATAYVLTIMGCAKSSDVSGQPANTAPTEGPAQPQTSEVTTADTKVCGIVPSEELKQKDSDSLRECTDDEFAVLNDWAKDADAAKEAVVKSGGRQSDAVVKISVKAVEKCESVQFYHTKKPCQKTIRSVVTPTRPTIKVYNAYSISLRCKEAANYLKKFNLCPTVVTTPPTSVDPVVIEPPVSQPPVQSGELSQCSAEEFAKLNTWRAAVDTANKNLARLGSRSNWKFDEKALDATKSATALCESLIAYHQARPCMREKIYTGQSLREQCAATRNYFYDYAQRTESLIVANARLYLDSSIFEGRSFGPGLSGLGYGGQCVVSNMSSAAITYSGQKVLITEARVNTAPDEQMFVMQTQEGLKLECYGLEYSTAETSLSEVMRLLAAKQTRLPMSYELN